MNANTMNNLMTGNTMVSNIGNVGNMTIGNNMIGIGNNMMPNNMMGNMNLPIVNQSY